MQLALADLASDQARVRLGASKTLRLLSQEAPELVNPHFETFARMLAHSNSVLRWNAILTLGNSAAVDNTGKIDGILESVSFLHSGAASDRCGQYDSRRSDYRAS